MFNCRTLIYIFFHKVTPEFQTNSIALRNQMTIIQTKF